MIYCCLENDLKELEDILFSLEFDKQPNFKLPKITLYGRTYEYKFEKIGNKYLIVSS